MSSHLTSSGKGNLSAQGKLGFNPDAAAIAIALLLAALVRLNVLPGIGW